MISYSRRQLAQYTVDEIVAGRPVDLAAHLAAALIASGRRKEVELLLADIDEELENRGLLARAQLTSAHPLSLKLKEEISAQLKRMTGVKEVVMQEEVDKSVIGGFRIETASRSWDKTTRRMLMNLRENI